MEYIGQIIKRLRDHKNWSQGQLAYHAGLSKTTISVLEAGKRQNPSAQTIAKIANALDASVDDILAEAGLLRSSGEIVVLYPEVREIQRILDALPRPERIMAQWYVTGISDQLTRMLELVESLRSEDKRLPLVAEDRAEYTEEEEKE